MELFLEWASQCKLMFDNFDINVNSVKAKSITRRFQQGEGAIRGLHFQRRVANIKFIFLSHLTINFENFSASEAAFMLNFPKHPNFSNFRWILEELWPFQRTSNFFETPCSFTLMSKLSNYSANSKLCQCRTPVTGSLCRDCWHCCSTALALPPGLGLQLCSSYFS